MTTKSLDYSIVFEFDIPGTVYSFSANTMKPTEEILEETCTILIVDDSEVDRLAYQRYLMKSEDLKYTTLESDSGEGGLALCSQHQPDIILLDYLLPDLNGIEFLQALKNQGKALPSVIMLTGQGSEQVAVEALRAGAQDYLVKGHLEPGQLVQAIRRALVQQNLQSTIEQQKRQQQLMAVMADVALRISQSLDLETILETAVVGIRQLLGCDRTLVYRFESDQSGVVVAESVLPRWQVMLGSKIEDSCFRKTEADRYQLGHKTVIHDIYQSHLSARHIQLLEQFEVKANVVVPILVREIVTLKQPKLWGLLMAHHCRDTRTWQAQELGMLDDLAVQLGIAIQQSELVSALERRAEALTSINHQLSIAAKLTETHHVD